MEQFGRKNTIKRGQFVEVPKPDKLDLWSNEFVGRVHGFKCDTDRNRLATVIDQDGNAFDVETHRLKIA